MSTSITDDILDFPYLHTLEGPATLRQQLDHLYLDEDIIQVDYNIDGENEVDGRINHFYAWTDTYVVSLIKNSYNEDELIKLPRNPEENK